MNNILNIQLIKNSTVLVRVGYDVPDTNSLSRIFDSLETIKLLRFNNNKIVLLSHWGRPKGQDLKLSFSNLINSLEKVFVQKIQFINHFDDFIKNNEKEVKEKIDKTNINLIILENTRFFDKENSKNFLEREKLAKKYSILGNFFVDEAFSVSHRKEATNYDIKKYLPNTIGLSYQKEKNNLDKLIYNTVSPYIFILAGSKLETKLPLIKSVINKVDKILLAGKMCFIFLKVMLDEGKIDNLDLANSEIENEYYEEAKELLKKYSQKIVLPIDFVYGNAKNELKKDNSGTRYAFDIGLKTTELFKNYLKEAKTIFWNGPLGMYEVKPFNKGTQEIGEYICNLKSCFKVIGGGDTNSSLSMDILDKFDFVSMGGGATLEYIINN